MRTLMTIGVIAGCSAVAGAQLTIGDFEGQWNNTTFGSSGAASMSVESLGGANISVTVDLDGSVFGQGDPDPLVLTGSMGATGFVLDPLVGDPTFGSMSGGVDGAGAISIDLVDAAGGFFDLVTLRGSAVGDVIHINYEIFDQVGAAPFAVGVIHMERVIPTPGTFALLGVGGLVATRRKR